MKRNLSTLAALAIVVMAVGCVSFNATVFKTEQAIVALGDTAMRAWADYYKAAKADPEAFKIDLAELEAERNKIDRASAALGLSLQALDRVRHDFIDGLTTKPYVQVALGTVQQNTDNLVALVNLFLPESRQILIK